MASQGNYYVPESSRLPIFMVGVLACLITGLANTLQGTDGWAGGPYLLLIGLCGFFAVLTLWFSAVHRENQQRLHSAQVKESFAYGMMWFIASEVLFFAGFFGALFYVRIFAVPWLGGEGDKGLANDLWQGFEAVWPLLQNPDTAWQGPQQDMHWPGFTQALGWLPLWNTIILVTSSYTVTIAHHKLRAADRKGLQVWLAATVALALVFLVLQFLEYAHAYSDLGLTLASGIYGTTFFMLTGFHGFHVTIGTIMLSVILYRSLKGHFQPEDHFGFEGVAWYWHFVDVVWVLLFIFVYCV